MSDLSALKTISDEYKRYLGLEGSPVAIKLLTSTDELEAIEYQRRPIRKLNKNRAICQIMAQARFYGRTLGAEEKYLNLCRMGADAYGFEVDDYAHVYTGKYFTTEEATRKTIEDMPRLKRGKYHAMVVAPLEGTPIEPDVVVFYGNATQIVKLINAYVYNKGERLSFSSGGDASVCCDPVVVPMQTGKPSLGIPCNGGRILSIPNETDIVFGIPFASLVEILDGIKFIFTRGGVRYPTAWQHIDWELQPPILYFLRPELAPKKE